MAGERDILAGIEAGEFVVTDEGVLRAEDVAARRGAGIELAEVTEEELAEQALREQEAEVFDAPLTTALERGVGAATFGLTDVLRGAEAAYEAKRRTEYNPTAAVLGELGGAVLPGLVSGGAGTAGTLARLTPAGRLSAITGRVAARGGIARTAAGGLIEGAAAAAGDYVSRVALDEDVEFSAAAMLEAAAKGGVLGAGIGGVAEGASAGIGRLVRSRTARAELGELGAAIPARPGILDVKPGTRTSYKSVVRRELAENNADAARALERRIDDAASSDIAGRVRALQDNAELARLVGQDAEVARLVGRADELARGFDDAARRSKGAWSRYADEVGLAQAKQRVTREASDEVEDAVVTAIAETEEAGRRLADVYAELAEHTGRELPPLGVSARATTDAASKAGQELGALGRARGLLADARAGITSERVTGTLGLAELAGTAAGAPTAADIPVVGDVMGLYLKYKGAKAALRGAGVLPATAATKAAERTRGLRERVTDSVRTFASRAARGTAPHRTAATMTGARAAALVADLGQVDAQDVENRVRQELASTTSQVAERTAQQARAAVGYLQQTAPRDPLPYRPPHLGTWEPPPHEAAVFARRVRSVADPAYAAARVLESALSAIELEALAAVHPAVLQALRADVMSNAEAIRAKRDHDEVRALGYRLGLPLTVETAFGARGPVDDQPATPPAPTLNTPGPSTPGASPAVDAERVERR